MSMSLLKNIFKSIKNITFSTKKRKIMSTILVILLVFFGWKQFNIGSKSVTYQTAKVAKGILATTISATGTITSGNSTDISTRVSGTVNRVYVTNGDAVVKGQRIAEVTLDDYAQERQAAAWVSYLDVLEAVKDAQKAKETADIQMWEDRDVLLDAQEDVDDDKGSDEVEKLIYKKTLAEAKANFNASELKYKNADANIANAQAKVSAALRDYQANSSTIVAPADGVISNLTLAEGVAIAADSSTSNTTGSTIISFQSVGKVNDPEGQLIATVELLESDIVNVKANQKVALTLDAYSDKTFTAKVLSVNTSGSVSSGVTTYPVTIILDKTDAIIYPNMAVSATIITNIKSAVILIDTSSIDTENDKTVVHVMKDGKVSSVEVTTGDSDDTQTEITEGLSEGDEIVTNYISASDPSQNNTTSSFGSSSNTNSRNSSSNRGGGMMMMGPGM